MSRGISETPRTVSPCPNNLLWRANASTAAHTCPSPDRDIAADAYATTPPDEFDSSAKLPSTLISCILNPAFQYPGDLLACTPTAPQPISTIMLHSRFAPCAYWTAT